MKNLQFDEEMSLSDCRVVGKMGIENVVVIKEVSMQYLREIFFFYIGIIGMVLIYKIV